MPADVSLSESNENTKRTTLLRLLEDGMTMIHLDPQVAGVKLPKSLASDPFVNLNLSYRFHIDDFDVGEETVSATLSFGGSLFYVVVPYRAIFGMTLHATGESFFWPEDAPPVVVRSFVSAMEERGPNDDESAAVALTAEASEPAAAPVLRAIDGAKSDESATVVTKKVVGVAGAAGVVEGDEEREEGRRAPRERPSWLRVVK